MSATGTRSWREERPVFVERLAPCKANCPAGENIREWLTLAQSGQYKAAWRILVDANPLPASMGRICYHPCEAGCNRAGLDGAVNINAVERFLGDEAIRNNWQFERPLMDTGKRVLVTGAGPSGLAAAYHLRRLGHDVLVQDRAPAAGGMMRYGIPAYRLPRDVLDAEIARIKQLDVTITLGCKVTDIRETTSGFDAVYLAVGAHMGKRADFAISDKVLDAVSLLRTMTTGDAPKLGRKVVVYGGGNTALDAARTIQRLGSEVTIVYRRTRALMPAYHSEIEEALEEGVSIRYLSTIAAMAEDGTLTLESMALDSSGYPRPTGQREMLACDTLVLALGQDVELDLLQDRLRVVNGLLQVGEDMMTASPGLFAGGDMVRVVRTAATAIGDGRSAARHIHALLCGTTIEAAPACEAAAFDKLHTWYYPSAARHTRPKQDAAARLRDFSEVTGGLDEPDAREEARRCLSCGSCFDCGSCRDICPEDAIAGAGRGFHIVLEKCTTCKLCVKECPCGAISVAPR